jgi:hypothetical protein
MDPVRLLAGIHTVFTNEKWRGALIASCYACFLNMRVLYCNSFGNTLTIMRHFSIILLILLAITFSGCEENDHDPNAIPKEAYTKTLYKSNSPDGNKTLTIKEHGWVGERGHTQVFIDFDGTGSSVYVVDTTGVAIKTYWLNNHNIVIETKKAYKGYQTWKQVQAQSFGDIVNVKYIER